MEFVTEAVFPPHCCAITGRGPRELAAGRLLDTGANTPRGERIYLSDPAVDQIADAFGYVPAVEVKRLQDAIIAAHAEADRLQEAIDGLARVHDVLGVRPHLHSAVA